MRNDKGMVTEIRATTSLGLKLSTVQVYVARKNNSVLAI